MKNILFLFVVLVLAGSVAQAQKKRTSTRATTTRAAAKKDTTKQPTLTTLARRSTAQALTLTPLDTVNVVTLTLQAQDWAWLVGDAPIHNDSTSAANFRKIRDKIRLDNPSGWTVNVTVTNLAGSAVMYFYRKVKTSNAGEIAARYTAITTAISGVANLAAYISAVDTQLANDYNNRRENGRYIIMDN